MNEDRSDVSDVPPRWFQVCAGLALVWNLIGAAAFVAQMNMDLTALPVEQQAFYRGVPWWANTAFGVAVFAGTAGCVALLLRRRLALTLFLISLIGLLVQLGHAFVLGKGIQTFGVAGLVMPVLTCGIAVALLVLARRASARGWCRA